jgi:Zn finger protein HypA/HybF involved in hydrogenase expression
MHELSLAQNLKQIISEKLGKSTLKAVEIEAGNLSGPVREAFDFHVRTLLKEEFGKTVKIKIKYVKKSTDIILKSIEIDD